MTCGLCGAKWRGSHQCPAVQPETQAERLAQQWSAEPWPALPPPVRFSDELWEAFDAEVQKSREEILAAGAGD